MKYLKYFEVQQTSEPQFNQYVICIVAKDDPLFDFVQHNIGQIVDIKEHLLSPIEFWVKFEEKPPDHNNPMVFEKREFEHWSYSKEDLEYYLEAKKYNI